MTNSRIDVDLEDVRAVVHPRLFGAFVEHLGRSVYTGLYEPGHPAADADGLRTDVIALVKELGVTTVRYPGGNFVSGYRWEEGIGPVEDRPRRLDVAWHSVESNRFGLDEFMAWTKKTDVEPMLAVNLGTRGLENAMRLLEYCNVDTGTALSDLRARNGSPDAHDVIFWCLGNEMDGWWQIGRKEPHDYAILATQIARAMKQIDGRLQLAVCGSSSRGISTFGEWERVVLRECYEFVDYITCHAYFEQRDGDVESFLASNIDMQAMIDDVVATIDHVRAVTRSSRQVNISFDEWNIWYNSHYPGHLRPTDVKNWPEAPRLIEDAYSVADAVALGGLLITLIRNAGRVKAASLAQLVNAIAPIMTEPGGPSWRQTTFFPFAQAARLSGGEVLDLTVLADQIQTARYGSVPAVDAVAVRVGETVTVLAVNRDAENHHQVGVRLRGDFEIGGARATALYDHDLAASNTLLNPDRVHPVDHAVALQSSIVDVDLPPASWVVLEITGAAS